jgi:hypothetical protein
MSATVRSAEYFEGSPGLSVCPCPRMLQLMTWWSLKARCWPSHMWRVAEYPWLRSTGGPLPDTS